MHTDDSDLDSGHRRSAFSMLGTDEAMAAVFARATKPRATL
ncbi:hypothetical protein BZL29_4050 [Mycobacterium kansasii]|uniref:Uncharacterized protein n=1 Tax=Mycobacterium kansasii TaxID=1768 RepID=A0A1V3XD95_MYCKA|nr:hypothetical protein BZL29_4050 [Mycobacterium kansasii]